MTYNGGLLEDMAKVADIRFKVAGSLYHFSSGEIELEVGDVAIVEVEKGIGIGKVVVAPRQMDAAKLEHKLKKVVRKADPIDLERDQFNREREQEAFKICKEKINKYKLQMKLVEVEYLFDSSKAIFYFTSESRVDFRELVKDLAGCFYTRIEMRQIGVRDEAKHVGGLGPCGRELCCSSFLQEFVPVTVKMAKEQNVALNPLKISGVCGRLMCCLGYEIGSGSCSKKGGGKGKPRDKAAATPGSDGRDKDKGRGRGNRRGEKPARAQASEAGASTNSAGTATSAEAAKDGGPGCGGCPSQSEQQPQFEQQQSEQQPQAQRPERGQDRNKGRNQGSRSQERRNRAEAQPAQGREQSGRTQNIRRPLIQNQDQNKGQTKSQDSSEGETKAVTEGTDQPRSRRSRGRSRGRGRSRRQRNTGQSQEGQQSQEQSKGQGQLEDKRQGQGRITDGSARRVDKTIVAKEPALLVNKPAAPLSIRRDNKGESKTDG